MCGLTLDIGARIIGCVGFIAALVVMMQLGGQGKVVGEGEGEEVQVRPLLGVTLEDFHPENSDQVSSILTSFLIFAELYACSSCLLVYASIVHSQLLAVPWLACEAVSFGFHVIAASITSEGQTSLNARTTCSLVINFFLTAFFWGVVCCAMISWKPVNTEVTEITEATETTEDLYLTPRRSDRKIEQEKSTPTKFSSPV